MKYKITITKLDTVTEAETNWERIFDRDAFEQVLAKNADAEQYGYRTVDKEVTKESPIYNQTRDGEIDLMAVIVAFNKPEDNTPK